jgi:PAS domain S-box-containing protein
MFIGRARGTFRWQLAAAIVPPLVAFLIQWYVLRSTMARWALFYPAVFVSAWLGGLASGLGATAVSSWLVMMFFVPPLGATRHFAPNMFAAGIFAAMGIAVSVVLGRQWRLVAELEQSQRWLQAIMDNSPSVIVIKDLAGRYLMVNRQLERILGIRAEQARGRTDEELFPERNAAQHRESDAQALRHQRPITYEETMEIGHATRVFQTSKFPLNTAGDRPFAICAIWTDITERIRTETALRQNEADLRAAEHIAHIGSWTWNLLDDSMRWSEELNRIFGREPEWHPAHPLQVHDQPFTPESTEEIRKALRTIRHDGRPYETELELRRPDGTTRWIAARGDAVRDANGRIVAIAGTAQDITNLKELQRLRDEWTSVIAHDLRQPIGVILMAASALPELHAASMTDKEMAFTARIKSAAQGLARLVDDLLDLSLLAARRLKLERQWVRPRRVIEEQLERLTHLTTGHRIVITEEQDVDEVCIDPMRVGQVLGNLVSNAVKYGDAGTEIVVHIAQRGTEVEIAVTNHGRGIPSEDLPRIFNRFIRAASARRSGVPGLGVGLYIAKELVEAHGGHIWVESTPGKTTTFHLTLPSRTASRQVA